MMNKNLIIAAVVVLILGIGGYFLLRGSAQESAESSTSEAVEEAVTQVSGNFVRGQKSPDVTFTDFEGRTHSLSDFQGRAVVLDFWARWCPFCTEEMPELQKAQEKYSKELVMIGVHRTDTESFTTGKKFAQSTGVTYLLVTDKDGILYRAAGGIGMPVAVFIDKDGVIQEIKSGPKTEEEIEEKVERLVVSSGRRVIGSYE